MKAYLLSAAHQLLVLTDMPDEPPGPGDATVDLRCAALNHRDVWIQKGTYHVMRYPVVPGADGAGVVSAIGAGVDKAWLGREVIINPGLSWGDSEAWARPDFFPLGMPRNGTFAQRITIPAVQLVDKPAHLSWEEAAALPLSGVTAFRAVCSRAMIARGERVLITGIGGGVALFAMQFALAVGARVFATSSSQEKMRRVKEMGVEGTANYRDADWPEQLTALAPEGFDVIMDSAVGPSFQRLIDLASPGGRIVFPGITAGGDTTLDMRPIYRRQLSILGTKMGSPRDFQAMVDLVARHRIKPIVDRVMPITDINEAYALVDRGEQFGKVVMTVDFAKP
ncbi:MAG: zinc-binding dehydrogenase [Pseudomonadota bacterium]